MLVLSRKVDESIMIGERVKVMVVGIVGGKVKLGIEAPRDLAISRPALADASGNERKVV